MSKPEPSESERRCLQALRCCMCVTASSFYSALDIDTCWHLSLFLFLPICHHSSQIEPVGATFPLDNKGAVFVCCKNTHRHDQLTRCLLFLFLNYFCYNMCVCVRTRMHSCSNVGERLEEKF